MHKYMFIAFLTLIWPCLSTEIDLTLAPSVGDHLATDRYSELTNSILIDYYKQISNLSICMIDSSNELDICKRCTPIFIDITNIRSEIKNASMEDPLHLVDRSYSTMTDSWDTFCCSKCLSYNETGFHWYDKALLFFDLWSNVTSCLIDHQNVSKCQICHDEFLQMKETVYFEDLQCFDIKSRMNKVFEKWVVCEIPVYPSYLLLLFIVVVFLLLIVFYFVSYYINRTPIQIVEYQRTTYKRPPARRRYNSIN